MPKPPQEDRPKYTENHSPRPILQDQPPLVLPLAAFVTPSASGNSSPGIAHSPNRDAGILRHARTIPGKNGSPVIMEVIEWDDKRSITVHIGINKAFPHQHLAV